ncbi:MAG: DUF3368 domain-containing protein [Oscillospiraceae bacterium]|jgi:predicted nucleic acid-binding protein|nr:DUF3368 domain-containing protein [Oscillospiraceae bacterium]
MIIVSDTTPIISLLKIEKLYLIQKLYDSITIPSAVYNELLAKDSFPNEIVMIKSCDFIQVNDVKNQSAVKLLAAATGLDKGESEAIALFEEINADLLLVDERKARFIAKNLNINTIGTLGILIESKKLGFISELRPLLEKLIENNIHISEDLFNKIVNLDHQ